MTKLIVIVGPTSSGKTRLAVELARKFDGEIVSADSRQVYQGMDIGTGKDLLLYKIRDYSRASTVKSLALSVPTKLSFNSQIPYYLIDIVSPRTNFTLAQYQKLAYRAIEDILRRGKVPILVGGAGLYVQAVVDGYVLPEAPPDPKLRARLAKLSLTRLRAQLKKLDPATYRTIDQNNRRRLERAIEICLVSGVPLSKQRVKRAPPCKVLMLGISVPKVALHRRIDQRLRERLKQGMIEEARRLHAQGISWKRLESFGLEYRYISRYLQEIEKIKCAFSDDRRKMRTFLDIQYQEMVRELSRAIKNFARRQITWFKRDKRIMWIRSKKEAERAVREFLS